MTTNNVDGLEARYGEMVKNLAKDGEEILKSLTPEKCHLLHMAFAIGGEVGELSDSIKKFIFYNKPITAEMVDNWKEELGDIEFYLEGLRQALNEIQAEPISRREVLANNMHKLLTGKNARYASGTFSDEQAQARADKVEEDHF